MARSARASAQLVAREGSLPRRCVFAPAKCARSRPSAAATIGEVGNSEHNLEKLSKAGASRWRGVRADRPRLRDEPG